MFGSMGSTSESVGQQQSGESREGLGEEVAVSPAAQRLLRAIVGIGVLMAYAGVCVVVGLPSWSVRRLYGALLALGLPLLAVIFWGPVVWASLRWLGLELFRRVAPSSTGKRSNASTLTVSLIMFGVLGAILSTLGYAFVRYETPYVKDWREGPVRRETVTCRDFRVDLASSNGRSRKEYVFELLSSDGASWEYHENRKWLDSQVEAGKEPYATVIDACRAEGSEIGILVYPHSGIILEAWNKS